MTTNNNIISFAELDCTKVRVLNYVSKQIPAPAGGVSPGSYFEIPIQYNYGTEEAPSYDDLRIELPVVRTNGGITFSQQNGKTNIQLPVSLPMTAGSETAEYVGKINELWLTLAYFLHEVKGQVNLKSFLIYNPADKTSKTIMPELVEGLFKPPIYFAKDGGNIIQGRPATQYLKLFRRGAGANQEKTLFMDLEEKPIDWSLLQSVETDLQPLWHVKKIYVGGDKARLQGEVRSAVVCSPVVPKGMSSMQTSSIERLRAKGYDASALAGSLSKLATERQNSSQAPPGANVPTPLVPTSGTMESIQNDGPAANAALGATLAATPKGFTVPKQPVQKF